MKKPYSVCDLPLEPLLRIASYLSFSDLWYFGTTSRSCQKLAHQLVWHKYHIDLARQRINSFNHMIHASVAYVCRYGYDETSINHPAFQSVANRLAVEIYDRTPQTNWAPCLDFLLDKALGIMLDHVLYDPSLDPLPQHSNNSASDLPTVLSQGKKQKYASTRMGRLMTTLLVTLYPTLTAMFDADPASAIHHRLLIAHISRHIDILTRRYHNQHRRRVLAGNGSLPVARTESVRHGFRVLVQFIGNLCQTELMTAADLHILTRQRITAFFISHQALSPPSSSSSSSLSSASPPPSTDKKKTSATSMSGSSSTVVASDLWQIWMDEIEFETAVLLDLLRAVVCRQHTRFDSGKELNMFATMLSETVSTLVSCKSSFSSISSPSATEASPPSTTAVVPAVSPSR